VRPSKGDPERVAPRRWARRLLPLAFGLAVALILVELGSRLLIQRGVVAALPPTHGHEDFWWPEHPELGAWKLPNASGTLRVCGPVRYRTNDVGARDPVRPRRADGPRVVILGDSFMEGYGVEAARRVSDRLERRTGIPHLNFAMSSFGPYQQVLAYRSVAKQFEHDAVIFSILPANDFFDLDIGLVREMPDQTYVYRPYLVGAPPEFVRFDLRESRLRRFLRRHTWSGNAALAGALAWRMRRYQEGDSFAYRFNDRQATLLEATLRMLMREAEGRRVVVVIVPTLTELRDYERFGPSRLEAQLRKLGDGIGFRVVDLTPGMAARPRDWTRYYLPCDYHWSVYGHHVAAEILERELRGDLYPAVPSTRRAF
jgi:hypothetical protein